MREENTTGRLSEIVRIGGYLIAGGALVGFSAGIYLLFNRALFSFFIRIGQFEVMSYFLSVFMPSFVVLITIGYLFATTLGLKRTNLTSVVPFLVLSLLCMVLSSLSVFFFISFFGGFLTLTALIRAYTKPAFKILSKREAFFMVEIGAMLVASSSTLFLSMWLLSNVFQTFAMGFYRSYSPFVLLIAGFLSFLMFFAIPLWGSRGTNAGVCGTVGLVMSIFSYLFVVQNQFVFFSAPAYVGIFMLVLGFISSIVGELLYVKLFFSEPTVPTTFLTYPILYHGRYCPYCGKPRVTASQSLCSECGRSLLWTPYAPFCSSCGRLVPTSAQNCPHCQEDIENKRVDFHLRDTQEHVIADKLITESRKKKSWIMNGLLKMFKMLQTVERALLKVTRFFNVVIERLSLTLKEAALIIIFTYLFGFLSFISYKRVENPELQEAGDYLFHYYGFPLEWLKVKTMFRPVSFVYGVEIAWASLVLNVMLYFLASFALVYGVAKLRR